ncbi:MAG: (2Fe-2S)-binding protein [Novosphingobium sp.]
MSISVNINGKDRQTDLPGEMPLLWVLRDEFGLLGAKFGCGVAACGACTVHVDGAAVRSCSYPLAAVGQGKVVTIEAIGETKVGAALQEAWLEHDVMQCGYCQAGQIMQATALLTENPKVTRGEAAQVMAGNICRCACYNRIGDAIVAVAAKLDGSEKRNA